MLLPCFYMLSRLNCGLAILFSAGCSTKDQDAHLSPAIHPSAPASTKTLQGTCSFCIHGTITHKVGSSQ